LPVIHNVSEVKIQ